MTSSREFVSPVQPPVAPPAAPPAASPVAVRNLAPGWTAESTLGEPVGGITALTVALHSDSPGSPGQVDLHWAVPSTDISAVWTSEAGWRRGKPSEWSGRLYTKATSHAPVLCLYGADGGNRFTVALSDALNAVSVRHGIHEESGNYWFTVSLLTEPCAPITDYQVTLRFDSRPVPYYEAIAGVSQWWAGLPGFTPAPVPDAARQPMYSTWYSFHQNLEAGKVEEQCRLAKELGCEAVIVDDGWQTLDDKRGYAYCGDWQPDRLADMKAHVARVHDLGMKYVLWYSVPFVGKETRAYARFVDKLLSFETWAGAGVLDPRFPEVREYLIGTYEQACREWDLDGFKLDFVDAFNATAETAPKVGEGRDIASVPEAVDRLLTDTIARLRALKPDIMVEFRQSYIGPLMRKYGNMFRAGDCPNDQNLNRVSTLDIRLLCGDTAAHSDMLTWQPTDTVTSAAMQLVHALFAVPQISVMLNTLPSDHKRMLFFWLAFWRNHRHLLLDGHLQPMHPEALYPMVAASSHDETLVALYQPMVVPRELLERGGDIILVNGSSAPTVVADLPMQSRILEVRNCTGDLVAGPELHAGGLSSIQVPQAGVAWLRAQEPV